MGKRARSPELKAPPAEKRILRRSLRIILQLAKAVSVAATFSLEAAFFHAEARQELVAEEEIDEQAPSSSIHDLVVPNAPTAARPPLVLRTLGPESNRPYRFYLRPTPSPPTPAPGTGSARTKKKNVKNRVKLKAAREAKKMATAALMNAQASNEDPLSDGEIDEHACSSTNILGYDIKDYQLRLMKNSLKSPLPVLDVDAATDFTPSKPAFIGLRQKVERDLGNLSLAYLLETYNLVVIENDGTKTFPITDSSNRIIGLVNAAPNDSSWHDQVIQPLQAVILKESDHVPDVINKHSKRSVAMGISFGGGQTAPRFLKQTDANRKSYENVVHTEEYSRLADHVNCGLRAFNSHTYDTYKDLLDKLISRDPNLFRPVEKNVAFAAVSINFGPRAISDPHTDELNKVDGWCAITALGDYNPKTSGHLVLWDLGLIIEFPPGTTIYIPSALIKHSNVALQPDETRHSIVHYTAGGLFRWKYNNYQTEAACLAAAKGKQANADLKAKRNTDQAQRWKDALANFPNLDKLIEKYAKLT